MQKKEIVALLRAHKGRARPVAFFHILRQPSLDPDDHAFLREHIEELGATDLLRWRARCEAGFTSAVIRRLAEMAIGDPRSFEQDVLNVPRLVLDEAEWIELEDLTRGKVPPQLFARIAERGKKPPREHGGTWMFSPRVLPDGKPFFFEEEQDELAPVLPERPLRDLSLTDILAARRAGSLTLGDVELSAIAVDRARTSTEDWSIAVIDFPDIVRDAVLEKARRAASDPERANLLSWLESRGVARATLLEAAAEAIRADRFGTGLITWLSSQLVTRAAWEKHGHELLAAFAGRRAFSELGEVVTLAYSEAARDGEPPRGLLEAIQGAFALVLIGLAREALSRGDQERALAALSSLACLDPPSRVSRAVHELGRIPGASAEVSELIRVNERLVKHSDARDASLEGIVAALHAIADAFG